MTSPGQTFVHLWLRGDRVACLAYGHLAEVVEFLEDGRPLCGDCRIKLLGDEEGPLPW